MAGRKHPQVITANRLDDGEVVYFTAAKSWSLALEDALAVPLEDDLEPWLTAAQADITKRIVVDVYPFDVTLDGSIAALSAREKIRAKGPTVREDLGKQADPAA